jgi:hypothetical protein
MYKQLKQDDTYVMDTAFALTDNTNAGYDLYTVFSSALDYTNNIATYGEMKWLSVSFEFIPFFPSTTVSTDYAIGAFGTRQGLFDITVTSKTYVNVFREPGSFGISNKEKWKCTVPIIGCPYLSSSMTNTIVSDIPKFNFYVGWLSAAATATSAGLLHVSLLAKFRCKID